MKNDLAILKVKKLLRLERSISSFRSINGIANTKTWLLDGKFHREFGPAVEFPDGSKEYFFKGDRHRKNGPAMDRLDTKEWFNYGKRHREDGPAVIWATGHKEYWLNDKQFKNRKEYIKELKK